LKCIKGFGEETWRKRAGWKISASMGGERWSMS
jgi:hypothetical protein